MKQLATFNYQYCENAFLRIQKTGPSSFKFLDFTDYI